MKLHIVLDAAIIRRMLDEKANPVAVPHGEPSYRLRVTAYRFPNTSKRAVHRGAKGAAGIDSAAITPWRGPQR